MARISKVTFIMNWVYRRMVKRAVPGLIIAGLVLTVPAGCCRKDGQAGPSSRAEIMDVVDLSPGAGSNVVWLSGCTQKKGPGYVMEVRTAGQPDGELEIKNIGYPGYGMFRLKNPVDMPENMACRLALEVKAEDCWRVLIIVRQEGARVAQAYQGAVYFYPPVGTYSWKPVEFRFSTLAGTKALQIVLENQDGGIVAFRRIKLYSRRLVGSNEQ